LQLFVATAVRSLQYLAVQLHVLGYFRVLTLLGIQLLLEEVRVGAGRSELRQLVHFFDAFEQGQRHRPVPRVLRENQRFPFRLTAFVTVLHTHT
jgi:hypothetical protein